MLKISEEELSRQAKFGKTKEAKQLWAIELILSWCPWIVSKLEPYFEAKSTGRPRLLDAHSALRCLILKHLNQDTYQSLTHRIHDSRCAMAFLELPQSPQKTALYLALRRIPHEALEETLHILTIAARHLELIDVDVCILDSTDVPAWLQKPHEARLLHQFQVLVSRFFKRSKLSWAKRLYHNHTRASKKAMMRCFRGKSNKEQEYKTLLNYTYKTLSYIDEIFAQANERKIDLEEIVELSELKNLSQKGSKLAQQVHARVFLGWNVEKQLSWHTEEVNVLKKGNKLCFGHRVAVTGTKCGYIADVLVYEGAPNDVSQTLEIAQRVVSMGLAKTSLVADRGFASLKVLQELQKLPIAMPCFKRKRGITLENMGLTEKQYRHFCALRANGEGFFARLKSRFQWDRIPYRFSLASAKYFLFSSTLAANFKTLANTILNRIKS